MTSNTKTPEAPVPSATAGTLARALQPSTGGGEPGPLARADLHRLAHPPERDHQIPPDKLTALRETAERAQAANTQRAYEHGWQVFTDWCQSVGRSFLPAAPETVILFLQEKKANLGLASLQHCVAAITQNHKRSGYDPPPTAHEVARTIWRGIRREKGTAPTNAKAPTTLTELSALVAQVDRSKLTGMRATAGRGPRRRRRGGRGVRCAHGRVLAAEAAASAHAPPAPTPPAALAPADDFEMVVADAPPTELSLTFEKCECGEKSHRPGAWATAATTHRPARLGGCSAVVEAGAKVLSLVKRVGLAEP